MATRVMDYVTLRYRWIFILVHLEDYAFQYFVFRGLFVATQITWNPFFIRILSVHRKMYFICFLDPHIARKLTKHLVNNFRRFQSYAPCMLNGK